MASKEDQGGCVTLTWEIQNFGLLLSLEAGSCCFTPVWKTEHTGKSVWRRLRIYFDNSDIKFNLQAIKCLQLDRCEISLVSSCMEVPLKLDIRKSDSWLFTIETNVVFGEKRQSILPNDTLTLRCKMWDKTMRAREFHINSVLYSFTYLWNIENFNQDSVYYKCIEEENFLFTACLENKSEKGTHSFLFDDISSIEHYVSPINFTLSSKDGGVSVIRKLFDRYYHRIYEIEICLNNTRLDLQLESVFAFHKVYQDSFKLPSSPRYDKLFVAVSGALGDDLLLLYRDKLFSDATLTAEGKTFHVHRSILSARSTVFRAMFEKDEMNEGRPGVVDIDDVGSQTMDQILLYLYGDSLKSVHQWEEASALYCAADKYDIQPLKLRCATGLKENLTEDNACEALVLADRHSDDQLMKSIVDFIHQNEEVITSEKWDSFENSNPLLAAKILRKIYVKNRKS